MAKEQIPFSAFVESVGDQNVDFVNELHEFMLAHNCQIEIKEAKTGYLVSYIYTPTKRTIANYVFRKKGILLRIYADNINSYENILEDFPKTMKTAMKKASVCKRLIDPTACNSRCLMGFDYTLDGENQQKCRYGGFQFFIDDESKSYLRNMMEYEITAREA